jgi:hypothetical protein
MLPPVPAASEPREQAPKYKDQGSRTKSEEACLAIRSPAAGAGTSQHAICVPAARLGAQTSGLLVGHAECRLAFFAMTFADHAH